MNSNYSIYNVHGYGIYDLEEIIEQCNYTVSEVSKRFNSIPTRTILEMLLSSKEYSPLFERSVDLYTKGLLSMTNTFICNHLIDLKALNKSTSSDVVFDSTCSNNCLKIIVMSIWFRGVNQSDLFKYINLDKVLSEACKRNLFNSTVKPEHCEYFLDLILKDGLTRDCVPFNVSLEIRELIKSYFKLNITSNVDSTVTAKVLSTSKSPITFRASRHHISRDIVVERFLDHILSNIKAGKKVNPRLVKRIDEINERMKMNG